MVADYNIVDTEMSLGRSPFQQPWGLCAGGTG